MERRAERRRTRGLPEWRPTPEEVARILEEMRPIVVEFARRARVAC